MKINKILFVIVLLFTRPAVAVDITNIPAFGTPATTSDELVIYDASAAEGSRITGITFSAVATEALSGTGTWIAPALLSGATFVGDVSVNLEGADLSVGDTTDAIVLSQSGSVTEVNFGSPSSEARAKWYYERATGSLTYAEGIVDSEVDYFSISSTGSVTLTNGTGINEFSIDGTMTGNSDDAVPTEQAVVEYVASKFATPPALGSTTPAAVSGTTGTFSGNLSGMLDHILETGATATITAPNCKGHVYINNDADVVDWTLPTVEEGLNCCFGGDYAGVITVDAAAGDIIILDGTALDAADEINSPGDAGDFVCLTGKDATYWRTWGRSGAWVDGGTD